MGPNAIGLIVLNSNYNSFIFDYLLRNSLSQPSIPQGVFQQLPAIPPHTYTPALLDFIVPRVLELTYTAWDLQPFAQDVGYDGPPFIWDEERRFLMRCELDALYFHLYQISRDDVDYIMETFPIVKRKDMARTTTSAPPLNLPPSGGETSYSPPPEGEGPGVGAEGSGGEYLTKRIILEMYDQMAALPKMAVPAPKSAPPLNLPPSGGETSYSPPPEGEGPGVGAGPGMGAEGLYLVPDVSQWVTWLNPPPADARAAHPDARE